MLISFARVGFAGAIKEWGVGLEGAFNIPIRGIGIGVRSHLHFNDRFFLSPQFSYFPGFNPVHEYYLGLNANYNLTPETKWGVYLSAGPYFDRWINWSASTLDKASLNNITAELGGGIVKNYGCFRPFLEYRADSKWWESNLRLGFLVYFGGCDGGRRNNHLCPAYTML